MNQITKDTLHAVIMGGNAAYIARTPERARNVNKSGVQKDCATALETINSMSDAHFSQLNALNLAGDAVAGLSKIATATNVKTVKRAAQVIASLGGMGVPGGSGRTLFLAVGAVFVAGCKTRDGLQWAVTRKGNENSSDGVNVEIARKLQKIGVTSPASFATQYSVCFAAGAMGDVFGIGHKGKKGEMPTLNSDAPFTRAILSRLAGLTEIEIEAMQPKGESDTPTPGKGKRKGKGK